MKVAVYAIAKNEEQFVQRWADSCVDADYRFILDTGSTDGTVAAARAAGVTVAESTFDQFRFDAARNVALASVPDDVDFCIALDLDEVLVDGWREQLQVAFDAGATRPRYTYVWSWNADGTPGLTYLGDKIHSRHDYVWRHPVHEVLVAEQVETQVTVAMTIEHHPDVSKPRSQYLPLLALSVEEDPDDDRNAFYYARELFFYGHHSDAVREFRRHLSLPTATWAPERSRSMRYLAELEPVEGERWLLRAAAEAPDRREPWVDLAVWYHDRGMWESAYSAAVRALAVGVKPLEYLCEPHAWGALPHDIAAVCAWRIGLVGEAARHGQAAVDLNPACPRLRANLDTFLAA